MEAAAAAVPETDAVSADATTTVQGEAADQKRRQSSQDRESRSKSGRNGQQAVPMTSSFAPPQKVGERRRLHLQATATGAAENAGEGPSRVFSVDLDGHQQPKQRRRGSGGSTGSAASSRSSRSQRISFATNGGSSLSAS